MTEDLHLPWHYVEEMTDPPEFSIESADGAWDVASLISIEHVARRITACVNACVGISTEVLEDGVVEELRDTVCDALRILDEARVLYPSMIPDGPDDVSRLINARDSLIIAHRLENCRAILEAAAARVPKPRPLT